MKQKRMSFLDIWNMTFGFLGIQFGFALQNANASRILQTFGADVEHILERVVGIGGVDRDHVFHVRKRADEGV